MASLWTECEGVGESGNGRNDARRVVLVLAAIAGGTFVEAMLCCFRTSRLARETRELTILSRTDPLTALPNRRHIEDHLTAALSAARRHDHPLSVLFIDIDGFKQINDRSGYEAGDEVLRAIADRIRSTLRVEDLVGRWGGEEFLAVLPNTGLVGAAAVGERVRAAVACEAVPLHPADTAVTVSVGCTSGPGDTAALIRRASHALREAKQAGKNRVVAADAPPG
jgi:two-component system, cell cycle response regulator